tara:strand:+ start:1277 stop:2041 length:765 start_codon:yes stop_codon:yes gene_type:complete
MLEKLTVIIPSRTHDKQNSFLKKATDSIFKQNIIKKFDLTILVAIDKGSSLKKIGLEKKQNIRFIESDGNSQAAALNAGIQETLGKSGFVSILEDDDEWLPEFLFFAREALNNFDFVSSNQGQFNEDGNFLNIFDFPTPSGWFMHVKTLEKVGNFNETFKWHLDNEWLGRLAETKSSRLHLIESNAQKRPELQKLVNFSLGFSKIGSHTLSKPLIKRIMHSKSGTSQILNDKVKLKESQREYDLLFKKFGRIPW